MLFLDLKIGAGITIAGMAGITVSAIGDDRVTLLTGNAEEILAIDEERDFGELHVILESVTKTTARMGFKTDNIAALVTHHWP